MPEKTKPRLTGYQAGQFKLKPCVHPTANDLFCQVNIVEISTFEHRRGMKRLVSEGVTV